MKQLYSKDIRVGKLVEFTPNRCEFPLVDIRGQETHWTKHGIRMALGCLYEGMVIRHNPNYTDILLAGEEIILRFRVQSGEIYIYELCVDTSG